MDIFFKNSWLQKRCCSEEAIEKQFEAIIAKKLKQRLYELDAAENLHDLYELPKLKCHQLKGNRRGQIVITVHGLKRMVFIPAHNPVPTTKDGGIDRKNVTAIKILSIEDYHGS